MRSNGKNTGLPPTTYLAPSVPPAANEVPVFVLVSHLKHLLPKGHDTIYGSTIKQVFFPNHDTNANSIACLEGAFKQETANPVNASFSTGKTSGCLFATPLKNGLGKAILWAVIISVHDDLHAPTIN
ncbi:hypothetical protein SeMB42_g00506 [Synchytrium endobioticum]|uniref:Uncharacterized protein n=1 Tax=Synchytrium endobioticum TaxID=286115 RepID=A0A507DJP8_9FUNG|nr:hypothetical protein SeLEV6574_g00065 [Synchytrium endobioticum]TPX53965.1 hypothetical protein SeMB42_g00506 [Synchytrium endobioticum]